MAMWTMHNQALTPFRRGSCGCLPVGDCASLHKAAFQGFMASLQVKLWDLKDSKPSLVAAQDLKVGAAFTAGFCRDAPWLLAAGGAGGTVAVWDIMTSTAVTARYGRQLAKLRNAAEAS